MKKIIGLILSLTMAFSLVSFTACGGRGSADSDSVVVGVSNNTSEINIINNFRTAYKKQTSKDITIERISGSFDNQVTKMANAKDLPDVIQVYDFSAEYWTNKGIYLPISEYMSRDGISEDDYFESVIAMTKSGSDGKMYWAARDYNKVVVCINTAIFEAADVDLPADEWTWSEFVSVCRQLNAKKTEIMQVTGQEIFYPVDLNMNWDAVYYPAIKSFGGDLFDKENGTAISNLEGVNAGFEKLIALADEGLAVKPTETGNPFPAKQCAMMFSVRPNIVSYANSLTDINGEATLDFVSVPTLEGVPVSYIGMGCTGYAITTSCPESKREAAWEFIKFMMTENGQEAFCASGAGVPVIKTMANDANATFRNYLPGKNHDAFVQFEARDLPMNYMSGFKTDKHIDVRAVLLEELTKNLYSASDRTAYYTELKNKLENAIK